VEKGITPQGVATRVGKLTEDPQKVTFTATCLNLLLVLPV